MIIFTHTIQEISKVVCIKKTVSETRAFTTSLHCLKRAHYSKRMLRKQVTALSFAGVLHDKSFFFFFFFKNFADFSKVRVKKIKISSSHWWRFQLATSPIGYDFINSSKDIGYLGIMFDDVMSMSTQTTDLSRSIMYHLRNITRILRFMDSDTCSNVVGLIVLSRFDYGNALLLGEPRHSRHRTHSVQN